MRDEGIGSQGTNLARILGRLYERFHHPCFIHPDPVELVWEAAPADREVAALVASSLALGRVESILAGVRRVLARLGEPREALLRLSRRDLEGLFADFRYRFFSGEQLAGFLWGIGESLRRFGTIEACFGAGMDGAERDLRNPLAAFVERLRGFAGIDIGILLSEPAKGSACKRLHLFLRWMVRADAIDPGGWRMGRNLLLVPVDVHMLRVSRLLGLTKRPQADIRASAEITAALAEVCPEDPVKYDFSMTRLGIHPDLSYRDLIEKSAPD